MNGKDVMAAMTYPFQHGLWAAWLMARATYSYTRSWDGCEGPDGKPLDFGRWFSFKAAVESFWLYLWKRNDDQ